jgi:hypothetical protein
MKQVVCAAVVQPPLRAGVGPNVSNRATLSLLIILRSGCALIGTAARKQAASAKTLNPSEERELSIDLPFVIRLDHCRIQDQSIDIEIFTAATFDK